jgi:hypothetical protein
MMPDEKQPADTTDDKPPQEMPVETEESGAGYGNNAGQQGTKD